MRYVKLKFTGEVSGEGYQEIDDTFSQTRLLDINGVVINDEGKNYTTEILEENSNPSWI